MLHDGRRRLRTALDARCYGQAEAARTDRNTIMLVPRARSFDMTGFADEHQEEVYRFLSVTDLNPERGLPERAFSPPWAGRLRVDLG
jgi:hypothetical protein